MRALVGAPLKFHAGAGHTRAFEIGRIEFVTCTETAVEIRGSLDRCFDPPSSAKYGLSFEARTVTVDNYRDAGAWRIRCGDFHAVMVGPQHKVAFGDATSFEVME